MDDRAGQGCREARTGCEPEDLPEGDVVEPHRCPQGAQLGNASAYAMCRRPDLCWIQLACRIETFSHAICNISASAAPLINEIPALTTRLGG